jgi:hypothetical protein
VITKHPGGKACVGKSRERGGQCRPAADPPVVDGRDRASHPPAVSRVLIMAQDPAWRGERIGDRERDAVVAMLQQAVSDGRLGLDELDGRMETVMRARTFADLEPAIFDLSGRSLPPALPGLGSLMRRPVSPGYSPDDPLRLDGAAKRVGVWTVPPFIRINQGSRWAKLDFQRAVTDAAVIDIDVVGGAGWILLILPVGWAADVDRLSIGWGSASVQVPREPAAGKPILAVHGSVGAGRIRLRTPKRRDRRIAERSRH